MPIGKFFKALVGGQPPVSNQQATNYVKIQASTAKGGTALSYRRLAVMTMTPELRKFLAETLKPAMEQQGYQYDDQPTVEQATGAQVVVIDGTPTAHARLHDKYDQVLRIKKSLNKKVDIYCAIGRREDYRRYPRGTYPKLLYFCMVEGDLTHRDPDLPLDGLDTVEGPRLYNLADIAPVIVNKVNEPLGKR